MQVVSLPSAVKLCPSYRPDAQLAAGVGKALAAQPAIVVAQRRQPHGIVPAGQRRLLRCLCAIGKVAVNMQIDKHSRFISFASVVLI